MHYLRLFTDRDVEPIKPTIRYFQPLIGKPDISRITDYINFYKNHRNIEGNVEEIVKLVSERKSYKFIDYHFNHLYNQNKNNPFKLVIIFKKEDKSETLLKLNGIIVKIS